MGLLRADPYRPFVHTQFATGIRRIALIIDARTLATRWATVNSIPGLNWHYLMLRHKTHCGAGGRIGCVRPQAPTVAKPMTSKQDVVVGL